MPDGPSTISTASAAVLDGGAFGAPELGCRHTTHLMSAHRATSFWSEVMGWQSSPQELSGIRVVFVIKKSCGDFLPKCPDGEESSSCGRSSKMWADDNKAFTANTANRGKSRYPHNLSDNRGFDANYPSAESRGAILKSTWRWRGIR